MAASVASRQYAKEGTRAFGVGSGDLPILRSVLLRVANIARKVIDLAKSPVSPSVPLSAHFAFR